MVVEVGHLSVVSVALPSEDPPGAAEDDAASVIDAGPIRPVDAGRSMDRGVARGNHKPHADMVRVRLWRHPGPQHDLALANEPSATTVGRAPRPEPQREEPRQPAHGRPCVRVARPRPPAVTEVEQQRPIGRDVALLLVDAAPEPSALRENVALRVPGDDLVPRARSSSENRRDWRITRRNDEEAARGRHALTIGGSSSRGRADRSRPTLRARRRTRRVLSESLVARDGAAPPSEHRWRAPLGASSSPDLPVAPRSLPLRTRCNPSQPPCRPSQRTS